MWLSVFFCSLQSTFSCSSSKHESDRDDCTLMNKLHSAQRFSSGVVHPEIKLSVQADKIVKINRFFIDFAGVKNEYS